MNQGRQSQSIRLFKSPLLERLTHVHPAVPFLYWSPIICFMLYRGWNVHGMSALSMILLGIFGIMTWTLVEYVLHRYVFHFEAESRSGKWLIYLFHGIHHDAPDDSTRLVMPIFPGTVIGVLFFFLFTSLMGLAAGEVFTAFFLIGYLCYDYTHFALHHVKPRTPMGKFLKKYHMEHHYLYPDTRFGVSSPFWDLVFGTFRKKTAATMKDRNEAFG